MLVPFVVFLALQAALAIPVDNDALDLEKDITLLDDTKESSRTLGLHKLNPFYWISDDTDDITERLEKLEKRQKILYDVLTCGHKTEEKCRKLQKLAAKLFKKKGASEEDEEDKPEAKPTKPVKSKPTKPTSAKPVEETATKPQVDTTVETTTLPVTTPEAAQPVQPAGTTTRVGVTQIPTGPSQSSMSSQTTTTITSSDPSALPSAGVVQPLTTTRITTTRITNEQTTSNTGPAGTTVSA